MKRSTLLWCVCGGWLVTGIAAESFPTLWPFAILSSAALISLSGLAALLLIRPYGAAERRNWYLYLLVLAWGFLFLLTDLLSYIGPVSIPLDPNIIFNVLRGISVLILIIGGLLEQHPPQREIARLLKDLGHSDKVVRLQALRALSKAPNPTVVEPVIAALADEDEFILYSAVDTLGATGDERALDPLLRALQDPDPVLRDSAVSALGNLGFAEAVPSLIDALSDDDPDVRASAAWALGELKDSWGVQPLIRALEDSDPDVRATAIEALGELGDPAALPMLQWVQAHDAGSTYLLKRAVRDIATEAIKEIQKRQASIT